MPPVSLSIVETNSVLQQHQMPVRMLKKVADRMVFIGPGEIEFSLTAKQLDDSPTVMDGIFMAYEQERERLLGS